MRRIPSASIFFLPLSLAVAACDGGSPEPTGSGGSGGGGTTSSTTAGSEPEHHRPAAVACTGDRPPGSIGIGPDGSLYIGDTNNHRVRRIVTD